MGDAVVLNGLAWSKLSAGLEWIGLIWIWLILLAAENLFDLISHELHTKKKKKQIEM